MIYWNSWGSMKTEIVIPMAGEGKRFKEVGYNKYKPFIDVNGKSMIERVLGNITDNGTLSSVWDLNIHLICQEHIIDEYSQDIKDIHSRHSFNIIPIEHQTEGAACTVLKARNYLKSDNPVMVINSDQIVNTKFHYFFSDARIRDLDGSIMTFPSCNDKFSYAELGKDNLVVRTREKEPISNHATVGAYYFNKVWDDLFDSCIEMIIRNQRSLGEFYLCPVYNILIEKGKKVGIYEIPSDKMHSLGTPEQLKQYLNLET